MKFLTTEPFFVSFHLDISPCQSSPCIRGGKCNVQSDGYSCDCLLFYSGRHCEGKYKKISGIILYFEQYMCTREGEGEEYFDVRTYKKTPQNLGSQEEVV